MRSSYQYSCPVEATLDVIGGKWKGVILFHLLPGPQRFSDLRRRLPTITQRMLTLQLRELEEDGVIHREIYQQIPPKVEYSLTEFGKTLEPILLTLLKWGEQYTNQVIERKRAMQDDLDRTFIYKQPPHRPPASSQHVKILPPASV